MNNKNLIFNTLILLAFAVACKSGGDSSLVEKKQIESLIVLDASQVKEAGIVTSIPVMDTFYETFPVTGMLVSPPAEKAFLQSPVSGWVDAILARPGDLVSKGTPIVRLKSAEAIEWQREYAEVRAELKQARTDYQRLKSLSDNEITAKKELLQAETRLQTLQARFNAARARLSLLNEDTSSLNMSPAIVLCAPITGILSNLNINLNSNIVPGTQIGYIINTSKIHLAIHLLPKDIGKIRKGQPVVFNLPGTENKNLRAVINNITPSLETESGGLVALAQISPPVMSSLPENLTVAAQVLLNPVVMPFIPQTAIIESENKSYVYEVVGEESGNLKLRPREIHIVGKLGDRVAITDTLGSIVISGTGQLPLP